MILKMVREGLGRLIVLINHLTRPSQVIRSEAEQGRVNQEAKGLALYQFYACPFCIRTRRAIHRLNILIEYRDAQNNAQNRNELLTQGGSLQVPCLRVEEEGQVKWIYESADIIQYLENRFGKAQNHASSCDGVIS
ncbi:MAG: glutathione S-transferase N-terminal domain-containing protein [Chlamydiae bacterium]|nr:glutathione S-transferase N-terminal domain-containing protein [Chlamydiota bacterium]MBI3265613.1 glutathione S-transferase N-terminal domain-containing protein [Chlamydiota bacterium]